MSISRWERGLLEPSADAYIRLGRMAQGADSWFFWGRAGLQAADVLPKARPKRGSPQLRTSQNLEPAHAGTATINQSMRDAVVPLRLLTATLGTHGGSGARKLSLDHIPAVEVVTTPAQWCPNPNYTSLLRVKGKSMEPLIRNGDIVAVDSFQCDKMELQGKIVVATSERRGMCVSRLQRYDTLDVLESENRDYSAIVLGKKSEWRIVGRVLWWISAAP